QFDDDAPLASLGDEVLEAGEIVLVPARQVELVATAGGARHPAPGPGPEVGLRGGSKRVFHDAEGAGYLEGGTREGARQIEAASLQLVEVSDVVEVAVEDCTVVFAGSEQDGRLTAEEEIVPVVGVQRQGALGAEATLNG